MSLSALVLVAGCLSLAFAVPITPLGFERLPNGNTLIADCGAGGLHAAARALEVDSLGRLIWSYVGADVPFLHTARRLGNGNTLLATSDGHKVIEVSTAGATVWTDSSDLSYPNEAYRLDNGNTLITDRYNNQVVEVTPDLTVVWSYTNLLGPHNGNRLTNGNTLICDSDNDRVLEVDPEGSIVWQYAANLDWPRCAQRLANGNTLITDSYHNRVIEVTSSGTIVWSATNLPTPFAAQRLDNGNTLVSAGTQVVELSPSHSVVWRYPNTVPVVVETLMVLNPTSGCSLYAEIHRPAYAGSDNRVPGVILVPGGTGYGSSYDTTSLPDDLASDGFAFMHFDPSGRGKSTSYPENYDGYINQDGMHVCLSLLASKDYVDMSRLGIYSRGYGITMASGMIARYKDPQVKFLLDFEGPANRSQTCMDSGGFVPIPADSEAFWEQREAARFMKQVSCAYLRMQTAVDHDTTIKNNIDCIELIDSATAKAHGGGGISVWTRVNDATMNPANRAFTTSSPPAWIPEAQEPQDEVRALLYMHELAEKDLSAPVAETRAVVPVASLRAYPRPCRGVLELGLPLGTSARELRVHDVCGRLVRQTVVPAGRSSASLDLRGLPPAVYYVSVNGAGTVPVAVVR